MRRARMAGKPQGSRSESAQTHYVASCHKERYTPARLMLHSYVPAVVFLFLGTAVGLLFTWANRVLGPRRPSKVKEEPYQSGLPSEIKSSFRFRVGFYLLGMFLILFAIGVVFLFRVAVRLKAYGTYALAEVITFIVLLFVAFVLVWRRGALEWRWSASRRAATTPASSSSARARCC